MSIRKQYRCCWGFCHEDSYIEKWYPDASAIPGGSNAWIMKENLRCKEGIFDDGIVDRLGNGFRDPKSDMPLQYSLNKRGRWRIMSDLPRLIEDASSDVGPADTLPVSCIVRRKNWGMEFYRTKKTFKLHQACDPNVIALSSTLFPPTHKHVCVNAERVNKASSVSVLAEKAGKFGTTAAQNAKSRPTGKQPLRGSSRFVDRHLLKPEKPPKKASPPPLPELLSQGLVYGIAVPHHATSHVFRKDRHEQGYNERRGTKSRLKSKTWERQAAGPMSRGYNYLTLPEVMDRHDEHESELCSIGDYGAEELEVPRSRVWSLGELIDCSAAERAGQQQRKLTSNRTGNVSEDSSFDLCSDTNSDVESVDLNDEFELI